MFWVLNQSRDLDLDREVLKVWEMQRTDREKNGPGGRGSEKTTSEREVKPAYLGSQPPPSDFVYIRLSQPKRKPHCARDGLIVVRHAKLCAVRRPEFFFKVCSEMCLTTRIALEEAGSGLAACLVSVSDVAGVATWRKVRTRFLSFPTVVA